MGSEDVGEALVPSGRLPDSAVAAAVALAEAEQQRDSAEFAAEFIKKVIRIRGVRIERAAFLRQELRKVHLDDQTIVAAIESTPCRQGIPLSTLDAIGTAAIAFETNKSAAMSFAAGLPGGFAMGASIPADITQYYVHAFRVMQKLAYLNGWQSFLNDLDDVDDETLGKLSLFLGVMMGVGSASVGLTNFAQTVARPALQKQISKQALTKTAWYGPMKQVLGLVGIKVTKDSFAKTVTKTVPLVGGVISGGMTLVSLRLQSERLHLHLRELPPPGMDAAAHRVLVEAADVAGGVGRATELRDAAKGAAASSVAGVKDAAHDARAAGHDAADRARGFAASALARARRKGSVTASDDADSR